MRQIMNYHLLLDLVVDLGYRLAVCGAETYRVEESATRILAAYGLRSEVFALPNCLTVSIETDAREPLTKMRRIGPPENDLDSVERYSGLSRRLCAETPDPIIGRQWLKETDRSRICYSNRMQYVGHFLGAAGYTAFFGGTLVDCICGGICGLVICASNLFQTQFLVNRFFRTIISAFLMALPAYLMARVHLVTYVDSVIIGSLMILVPGLLFTNAMRDIIFGDTNSGINRVVQVLLIAVSIALGTGTALSITTSVWGTAVIPTATIDPVISLLGAAVGCVGFAIIFNIHGPGVVICTIGGVLTWIVYLLTIRLGCTEIIAYFWGTVCSALYAEIMARIRKYPAISYLVIAAFPLLPGGGVYYTMNYAVQGDMENFSQRGMQTIAIAGAMAAAILLVSTAFRLVGTLKTHRLEQK